jgi:hypothetical protein
LEETNKWVLKGHARERLDHAVYVETFTEVGQPGSGPGLGSPLGQPGGRESYLPSIRAPPGAGMV